MILWTFTRQVWFCYIVVIASCSFNPQTILAGCQELSDGGSDRVCSLNTDVLRTREGLAQLHSSLHLAFCESNVIVARFHALVKLEKEEARALLENLPDEYAAMLGENQNWLTLIFLIATLTALMYWFVTLASKMTGTEIPGVGMAPGGKIVEP